MKLNLLFSRDDYENYYELPFGLKNGYSIIMEKFSTDFNGLIIRSAIFLKIFNPDNEVCLHFFYLFNNEKGISFLIDNDECIEIDGEMLDKECEGRGLNPDQIANYINEAITHSNLKDLN